VSAVQIIIIYPHVFPLEIQRVFCTRTVILLVVLYGCEKMRLRLWANHRLTVTLYVILKTVHHLWNLVQFELHLSSSNSKTLRIGADRAPLSSKRVRKTLGPRGRDIYACGAQLNCHPYFLFCRRKNTDCVPETLCFYFVFKAPRWT